MILQLVYASRPFGFDAPTLAGILVTARRRNPMLDITGALICRDDLYLQMLEGPADNIRMLYNEIRVDDRHIEVAPLLERHVEERLFPDWAMRHDPDAVGVWSPDAVHEGAPAEAGEDEILAIFARLAAA